MMLLEGLTNSHENGPQTTCIHLGLRGAQNNAGFTSGHYEKSSGVKSKVWANTVKVPFIVQPLFVQTIRCLLREKPLKLLDEWRSKIQKMFAITKTPKVYGKGQKRYLRFEDLVQSKITVKIRIVVSR